MIDHDAKPGPLEHCQICGSDNLRLIIDLGFQPPCASLLTELHQPEISYPLRLWQCEECSLAQLDYVVPAKIVYPENYPYKAGISWPVVAAHKQMAKEIVDLFGTGFCVDIGCNDGTLLIKFKELGCETLGVEPTGIADIAKGKGVDVIKNYFSEKVADDIVAELGLAHIITFTNVFAHMANLGEVMRGLCKLLSKKGVLVIENHYLADILERVQFDSIYHEHIRTYTLRSLETLFRQYGMTVFDVDRVPRYGGNIRIYVCWRGQYNVSTRVSELKILEDKWGLNKAETWEEFRKRVYRAKYSFMSFVLKNQVVGCSAPGRASTLLNFFGVRPEMMPWTGEPEGSLKIGKYIPGCHIAIVSNKRIVEEQPDHIVLLAWHYAAEITDRLRSEGVRGNLICPL